MAGSVIFDDFLLKALKADIDFDLITVKVMMTLGYTPNAGTHLTRADVTGEVTGTGYSAGGKVATCSLAKDTSLHKTTITLGAVTWASSTFTADRANYYVSRGGLASADELIASIFTGSQSSSADNWNLAASSIIYQNLWGVV